MNSSTAINYNLRPAKSIERKMLAEAFQRLSPFGAVKGYRYVGFGSFYFSDFALFHGRLGITKMVSIERDKENNDRFTFNKPYNCIDIEFGESNDVLPKLDWDVRSIVWLDYDGKLDKGVLADINFICTNALPGSIIIFSVNVHPDTFPEETMDSTALYDARIHELATRIGEENIPIDITSKDLTGWNFSELCRKIIGNNIDEAINYRSGPKEEDNKIQFVQLYNFEYQDGARMLTYGGILIEKSQMAILASCDFSSLSFTCPKNDEPYRIEVPKLTFKEIRHLNSQLPLKTNEDLEGKAIPQEDLNRFKKIYRYFPAFTEADI
jgi:hypothetical protein